MRIAMLLAAVMLFASAGRLEAHAHLLEASPAEGSVLKDAPHELVLRFSEAARLTTLSLTRAGAAPQKLPLPAGGEAQRISLPLPALTPGRYQVSYRALSADGHVVPGELHFTIAP